MKRVDEKMLAVATRRIAARGGSSRRLACMRLPDGVFQELCRRLLDRSKTVQETAEWLATSVPNSPSNSAVERFSDILLSEWKYLNSCVV